MDWRKIRAALTARYRPRIGRRKQTIEAFALRAGISSRTVHRIMHNERDRDKPIDWETLTAWVRATGSDSVGDFLNALEEPTGARDFLMHKRRTHTTPAATVYVDATAFISHAEKERILVERLLALFAAFTRDEISSMGRLLLSIAAERDAIEAPPRQTAPARDPTPDAAGAR